MNGIIVNICTTVWMMTVVGSVLFGCWGLFYRFFDRPGQIKAVYYALRLVLVFYLVPVATLLLWLEDYDFATDSTEGYFFTFTPGILQAAKWASWIWLAGVSWMLFSYLRELRGLRKLRKSCEEAADSRRLLWEACRQELGIKRNVLICQGENLPGPLTVGVISPAICLPKTADYTEEQWKMALLHEWKHCQFHDVLVRCIAAAVLCVHWFNPAAWYLFEKVKAWGEYHCDYEVCRYWGDGKGYAALLYQMSAAEKLWGPRRFQTNIAYESKHIAKERIQRMRRYQNMKRQKTSVAVVLSLAFLLAGAITSYGAVRGAEQGYELLYQATRTETREEVRPPENYLTEYTTDTVEEGIRIEVEEDGVTPYNSTPNINWTLENNVQRRSGAFLQNKGESITVVLSATPSDSVVKVGIVEPDGDMRYVQASGFVNHTFSADQSGNYRVYVENQSGKTVTVTGLFHYN